MQSIWVLRGEETLPDSHRMTRAYPMVELKH